MTLTPSIRFFRSPTGHRIAYAHHGRGPALVCTGWWVSLVEGDWKQEGFRSFFGRLGERFSVYRFDRPGTGLSDRARDRVVLDDEVTAIEALFEHEHLPLEICPLFFALGVPGAFALALASAGFVDTREERVELILHWKSAQEACAAIFDDGPGALPFSMFSEEIRRDISEAYVATLAPTGTVTVSRLPSSSSMGAHASPRERGNNRVALLNIRSGQEVALVPACCYIRPAFRARSSRPSPAWGHS